jgi:hypothetical protein
MKEEEIKKLAELRSFVISFYNNLENKSSGTSLTSTRDAAYTCESIIRSMDDLLKEYVNFE